MNIKTPAAEINIDYNLVRKLIDDQFPQYTSLNISHIGSGWDNEIYKLGEDKTIRLPRREKAVQLIINEQKYLKDLARQLPISIPAPLHIGSKNKEFDWPWSITPFYQGNTANKIKLDNKQGIKLSLFLKALHTTPPSDLSINESRALGLESKTESVKARINTLSDILDKINPHLLSIWDRGINSVKNTDSKLIHGDLHPRNIICDQNKIIAVIDWGDMTGGDPATDLACLWMLFNDSQERENALEAYGATNDLINRSKSWAVFFGSFLVDNGLGDNPEHYEMGIRTIKNLI